MKFSIPFTFLKISKLKKKSEFFLSRIRYKKKSKLGDNLQSAAVELTREEYLAITFRSLLINFFFLFVVSNTVLFLINVRLFFLWGFFIALAFAFFVLFSQIVYPRIYIQRKQRNIEQNLISALQDILIQLNSGVTLFNILVNISDANYGELSMEFKKAVKKINAGEPESEVLDELGEMNPSVFFRRTLWQISNGMKAGSDMVVVVKDSVKALNEEQLIQVQNYGNKLNPLIVFYMLIAVIIPALSITFLTIISSMVGLAKNMTMLLFFGLFIFVILFQIMFLGLIKSRRPSLL